MERLRSVCLLGFIAFAAQGATGQQTTPTQHQAGTVAVIGDVARCDVYTLPTGSALSVQQTVQRAGLLSDMAQVTVIRSGQDRAQWTQLVAVTSSDNGEPVTDGDVLVVQAMSPLTAGVQENAALRTDTGVLVVGLTEKGIVIGDVLRETKNLPISNGQLKVISRFQGRKPIDRAELHLPVAHGDVVSISSTNHTILSGFGAMSPSFSEWKGTAAPVARDPFVPNIIPQDGDVEPEPFQFPPFPAEPAFESLPDGATSDRGSAPEIDSRENDAVPALTVSQSEDIADSLPSENENGFTSDAPTVAPVPPVEIPLDGAKNAAAAVNPWNLVFIGGLLLAGTLILAGTMKPDTTDEKIAHTTSSPRRTILQGPALQTVSEQKNWQATPAPAALPTTTKAAPQAKLTETLIRDQEWFSTDWNGGSVSTDPASAGETPPVELATSSSSVTEEVKEMKLPEVGVANADAAKAPPQASVSEKTSGRTESLSAAVECRNAVSDKDFSDLEDLLQNRLPIDLCETQLPRHISLFGKPAGPLRLRIDAAHADVPRPHMNLSADKRREVPVTAADNQASEVPRPATAAGSLDRALHFLQERTTS